MNPITDLIAVAKEVQIYDDAVCNQGFAAAITTAEAFMEPVEPHVKYVGNIKSMNCGACWTILPCDANFCPGCGRPTAKRPA